MRLNQALREANGQGRMGLILYSIPNFPDPTTSRAIHAMLEESDFVSIIETAFPVRGSFSEHANSVIREAHEAAAAHGTDIETLLQSLHFQKPSLCVLYEESVRDHGFEGCVQKMSGKIDAVLLEWSERDHSPYASACRRHDLELVQCVGPWMKPDELKEELSFSARDGIVYLMSAPMTGAKLFAREELSRCIAACKEYRPDLRFAAGFGVREASDVRALQGIPGLDAVIIGTAFLEKMRDGVAAVSSYLRDIEKALRHL
jgi:tryptophan synthase alpha subunit